MPESPKWLEKQGRHEEAELALSRIRQNDDNSDGNAGAGAGTAGAASGRRTSGSDYEAVTAPPSSSPFDHSGGNVNNHRVVSEGAVSSNSSRDCCNRLVVCCRQFLFLLQQLRSFVRESAERYRRQANIAVFLSVTQQFCGQTNVLSYAPIIFSKATSGNGASADEYVRGWATLSIGMVKFLVTILVIWKVERIGRRVLLLAGMATIALGLMLLAVGFAGTSPSSVAEAAAAAASSDGSDGTEDSEAAAAAAIVDTSNGLYLAMPGVLLVVSGYSMSFGPLTWLLTSELFPTEIRGRALGFSTIITYLCGALVTVTFLSSQEFFGPSPVFCFYLLITCLGIFFAYAAIPDTKDKSAEEIDEELDRMPWEQSVWHLLPGHQGIGGVGDDTSPLFGGVNGSSKSAETELSRAC